LEKTVERLTFDGIVHATKDRRFYAFNVPSERITFVRAGKVQRKNESEMSDPEKTTFKSAISNFNSLFRSPIVGGTYGQMVAIHALECRDADGNVISCHRMHSMDGPVGTQRFLTWHRIYLAYLEGWIRQNINSDFFIPYWDWVGNPSIPDWLKNFTPNVFVPLDTEKIPPEPSNWLNVQNWARSPGQQTNGFLPTSDQVNDCLAWQSYSGFTRNLEWLHNGVHTWVGGPMIDIMISPADPLFWLHHGNVDRIWSMWQTVHPDQNPDLSPADQYMDPWNVTEPEWRTNLYSEYV
jgi:tyrosinase